MNFYLEPDMPKFYLRVNDRWEIAVCASDDNKLEHVSFVNGIYTFKGGKHVEPGVQQPRPSVF